MRDKLLPSKHTAKPNVFLYSLLPDFVPEQAERDARDAAVHEPVEAAGLAQLGGGRPHLAGGAEATAQA